MFRDLADMQQTFGSRNDFNEGPEIRQPRDFAKISLPHLGSSGQIADDLNGLVCGNLVV